MQNKPIELRSDTFTLPDKGMLDAMYRAEVGDDVFGEDPTVVELENKTSQLFGKEASLFCPSGTMCNQIAIKSLSAGPGELICDAHSHVYLYEGGGIAFHSGLSVALIETENGLVDSEQVRNAINPDNVHKAKTQLVVLENTHNRGGGSCYDLDTLRSIKQVCDEHDLRLHLDGARIFNACIAKGYNVKDVAELFDTFTVCLSKGLGAPVGSMLVGSWETVHIARRLRKVMGGAMRQAGYLAAAGIYALNNNIERLEEDHSKARYIGNVLQDLMWVSKVLPVETNIIVFHLTEPENVDRKIEELRQHGVLAVPFGIGRIRMVTHLGIDDDMVNRVEKTLKSINN